MSSSIPLSFEFKTHTDNHYFYSVSGLTNTGSPIQIVSPTQISGSTYKPSTTINLAGDSVLFTINIYNANCNASKICTQGSTLYFSLTVQYTLTNGVANFNSMSYNQGLFGSVGQIWIPNNSSATDNCVTTPYGVIEINTLGFSSSGISLKLTAEKIQQINPATTPPGYCS